MSRVLTARLAMLVGAAVWIFSLYGCQSEAPAPIQGDVSKADASKTAKEGGPTKVNPGD